MTEINPLYPQPARTVNFGGVFTVAPGGGDVTKEGRKQRVLAFLVDARLALPRKVLFRNMAYHGADFSESTIKNYLRELREEGLIERVDAKKFAKGAVVVSNDDPGYWIATTEGVEHIESVRADQRMQQKAPGGEVMSKKELTRYWIAQGLKLDAREDARAGLE